MFATRGAVHRNLVNAQRDREIEDDTPSQRSGRFELNSAGEEVFVRGENIKSPVIVADAIKAAGDPPNDAPVDPPAGAGGADSAEPPDEETDDSIQLIPYKSLSGLRRVYVRVLANNAIRTLNNQWFSSLVMSYVCWASLSVGLQTYPVLAASHAIDCIDYSALSVFILEALLKIVSEGLKPWNYWFGKNWRWNNFDFVIIVLSLPVFSASIGSGNIAILRMLRLMRIMKLVKRVPQLYMIVMGLIGGLKSIGYILLLMFLVFYLYAISGMYAWQNNDTFHFRSVPIAMVTLFRMSTLENWSNVMNINYFGCDQFDGGYYSNDPADAERFLYCNFTAHYGENVTDASLASTRLMNNFLATFYFLTFIVVSAFVMLSLFIGAITMSMTQSMEQMKAANEEVERKERMMKAEKRAFEAEQRAKQLAEKQKTEKSMGASAQDDPASEKGLSAAEKKDRRKLREVLLQTWDDCDLTDILTQNQGDSHSLKGRYLQLSTLAAKVVEHPKFTLFVTSVIMLAGLLVGLQTATSITDAIGTVLDAFDSAILAVFTSEVVLKLLSEGLEPWNYFRSGWNTFDFIIVAGSFAKGKGGMITMLRLLRLLRVLKLVRAFPQLQVIVSALIKGLGSIGYIGLILLLCFYVFGILGTMLFSNNDPFHFQYLHFAMISLFQCATMDGWSDVLYINFYGCDNYGYDDYRSLGYNCTSHAYGFVAVAYFCSFIVLGGMVLITLFVGVVTTSMEEATQEMEAEKELLRRVEELRVRKQVDQVVVTSYMQVFRMLDLDGSGSVEETELRIGLAAIGKHPTYEELREMMDVVDEDGSGQIDIVEFVEFMIHVREKTFEQKAAKLAVEEELANEATKKGVVVAALAATDDINPSRSTREEDDEIHVSGRIHIHAIAPSDGTGDDPNPSLHRKSHIMGELPPVNATILNVHNVNDESEADEILLHGSASSATFPSNKAPAKEETPRSARSSKYKIVPSG